MKNKDFANKNEKILDTVLTMDGATIWSIHNTAIPSLRCAIYCPLFMTTDLMLLELRPSVENCYQIQERYDIFGHFVKVVYEEPIPSLSYI